jgi:hypothetical protein
MPTYRVHFATEAHEPFPPLDELAEVEADEPLGAVYALVETGRYPQNRPLNWARVVLNTHDDGQPRQVLRVQVSPAQKIRVDWQPPPDSDDT